MTVQVTNAAQKHINTCMFAAPKIVTTASKDDYSSHFSWLWWEQGSSQR